MAEDLTFFAGDMIDHVEKVDDSWSRGVLRGSLKEGLFPTSFIEVCPALVCTVHKCTELIAVV